MVVDEEEEERSRSHACAPAGHGSPFCHSHCPCLCHPLLTSFPKVIGPSTRPSSLFRYPPSLPQLLPLLFLLLLPPPPSLPSLLPLTKATAHLPGLQTTRISTGGPQIHRPALLQSTPLYPSPSLKPIHTCLPMSATGVAGPAGCNGGWEGGREGGRKRRRRGNCPGW